MSKNHGAMLKIDGEFVNKDLDKYMDGNGINVPDYIYVNGAPRDFIDNYFVYMGNRKIYGTWVAVYKNRVTVEDYCNLVRDFNFGSEELFDDVDGEFDLHLKDLSPIYVSRLDPDIRNRFYMGFDLGGRHFECIFGYGITNSSAEWAIERRENRYSFSEDEIKEIDSWFGF